MKYIVGIDEAGRGPLAGPVSVGVVILNPKFNKKLFRGIRDSKKLTEKSREEWFKKAKLWKKEGKLNFKVALISEKIIDKQGIVPAIKIGMEKCLKNHQYKHIEQLKIRKQLLIVLLKYSK